MSESQNNATEQPKEEVGANGDVSAEEKKSEGAAGDQQPGAKAVAAQLMQNPQVLAALQDRLGSIMGTSSGYIQSLPKSVKRRLKALKKLQFESIKVEAKFMEEVHQLECKYAAQYTPIFQRRKDIVGGAVEPTDSDCDWPSDEEDDEEIKDLAKEAAENGDKKEVNEKAKVDEKMDESKKDEEEDATTGVPQFWLTIFKNVDMLSDMVQEHDEPILKHLQDIKVNFMESDPMGFSLDFTFSENEFFSNAVLTKRYLMKAEPDEDDPFGFEGPEIIKCEGCTIDWKAGKNVTVKVIKKTQKHKGRGTKRTVSKTVQNDSFFNFFTPPKIDENNEDGDDETEALLAADFEIGHFIRERIVPRAVLYFTGEALEDDEDDYDEGDEEGEDDDDEDYDEDADPDFEPQGQAGQGECKQQ